MKNVRDYYQYIISFFEKYQNEFRTMEILDAYIDEMCVALDVENIQHAFENLEGVFSDRCIDNLETIQDNIKLLLCDIDENTYNDIWNMFIQKYENQAQDIVPSAMNVQSF